MQAVRCACHLPRHRRPVGPGPAHRAAPGAARRPPPSAGGTACAAMLRPSWFWQPCNSAGAEVRAVQADVAQPDEVARVLGLRRPAACRCAASCTAAGLLADGALMQQHWSHFVLPLGPKVTGTWALHTLTAGQRLDFFVLYSSMASVLGSAGPRQPRRRQRLHGCVGVAAPRCRAAGAEHRVGRLERDRRGGRPPGRCSASTRSGIDAITPAHGLELLEALMESSTAPHVAVFPVRWSAFLAQPQRGLADARRIARVAARAPSRTAAAPAPAAEVSATDGWLVAAAASQPNAAPRAAAGVRRRAGGARDRRRRRRSDRPEAAAQRTRARFVDGGRTAQPPRHRPRSCAAACPRRWCSTTRRWRRWHATSSRQRFRAAPQPLDEPRGGHGKRRRGAVPSTD